jgi:glycyl-tRNA synthetase beta chain
MPDALVDEVTSIVEWPEALLASFDKAFLLVPAEVLIAAMQSHQKCFALRDQQGKLLPNFITVANISSQDPKQVVLGNEKVVHARLSDAAFFYHQDKKQKLAEYQSLTAKVVFQDKLGTLQDKSNRVKALMEYLAGALELVENQAIRAAELCKCDLMTGMVGEFPELQGFMGCYYALNDGEDEAVAQALKEQYRPRFAADDLPQTSLGLALSLADRMDTLVGTFAIGQKPTGVKDPFKLRRHALAIVRLLQLTPIRLNLSTLIDVALSGYGQNFTPVKGSLEDLKPFILERLSSFYQSKGIASELVQAARVRQDDWLFDMDKRIGALLSFKELSAAVSLSAACKRVNNLLQHSTAGKGGDGVNKSLLKEPAEKVLFQSVEIMEERVQALYSAGEYEKILVRLAELREPIDAFFEQVMVMVDDQALKQNRLSLLSRLRGLLMGVADISLLSS